MNKTEWEDIYRKLDGLHSDFLLSYPTYTNGKNKKIRDAAERKVRSSIDLSRLYVKNNSEVRSLFVNSEFGHMFAQDEFWQPRYFGGDMSKFLTLMKEKIQMIE